MEVGVKETVDLIADLFDRKRINYTKVKSLAIFFPLFFFFGEKMVLLHYKDT